MRMVIATFTSPGTAGAQDVELGFEPVFVRVLNTASLRELVYKSEDTVNAFGVSVTATGLKATIGTAANGIVIDADGDRTTPKGFAIGASAAVNATGVLFVVEAGQID